MIDVDASVVEVAHMLLGRRLTSTVDGRPTSVILDEVEAYGGADDAASHAFRGRTPRNWPMFEAAGTLYVYRSYGIHWCANVVTGRPDDPQAVLLRGGVVDEGLDTVIARRSRTTDLTDGPGKLTQALGIDGTHSGTRLDDGPVAISDGPVVSGPVRATPRIGITKAVDRPWRFLLDVRDLPTG